MISLSILPVFDTLAVVPIVVNTGAALMPAIVAGLTTAVSLIFKPKELIKLCKRKPLVPVMALVIGFALWWVYGLFTKPAEMGRQRVSQAPAGQSTDSAVSIDWTLVALEVIRTGRHSTLAAPTTDAAAMEDVELSLNSPVIFRSNPSRTGYEGGPVPENLVMNWRYYPVWTDFNGAEVEDVDSMMLSSPAVVGPWVYGASCLLDPPYNYGTVFALNKVTGQLRWSFDTINDEDIIGFYSSPAITADGKNLLIGQGLHPDANCNLICLNTEDGSVNWTIQVSLHIESSPAIEGDVVVVGAGAIEDPATHKPTSHPGFVLAARISDGEELWRYDLPDPESSPILLNGVVYIGSGFNGNAIYALRADEAETLESNGQDRLLWKLDTDYPITCAITLSDDLVFAGGGNGDLVYRDPNPAGVVYAINKDDGSVVWKVDMPDAVLGAITATDDAVICPVANGQIMALSKSDGSVLWSQRISGHSGIMAGSAAVDDVLFAVSKDGYMAKLSMKDGSILEKHYINDISRPGAQGLSISSPTLSDGMLYIGSETGGLRAYSGSVNP